MSDSESTATPVDHRIMWHVVDGAWDGCDVKPLCEWMTRDAAQRYIAEKWPDVDFDTYWLRDARSVHLYPERDIALNYADEGDTVLAVNTDGLTLGESDWERPVYPLVTERIPASRCSVAA